MYSSRADRTIPIIASAILMAILCVCPSTKHIIPIRIFSVGANIGDTFLHELGHSLTAYLYGIPNLPAMLTIFSADEAAGYVFMFEREWVLQILVFAGLGTFCYWLYAQMSYYYFPTLVLTVLVLLTAFTKAYISMIDFMGHGSSILFGGFFLYRGLRKVKKRKLFDRWLCAFFGVFLIFNTVRFCNQMMFDNEFRAAIAKQMLSQPVHNDFIKIATQTGIGVQFVAFATLLMAIAVFLAASSLATYRYLQEKNKTPQAKAIQPIRN